MAPSLVTKTIPIPGADAVVELYLIDTPGHSAFSDMPALFVCCFVILGCFLQRAVLVCSGTRSQWLLFASM